MRKLLIDVNVPKALWLLLKKEKFSFICLHDLNREMDDINVVQLALKKKYIIVTSDKDFAGLQGIFPGLQVIIFHSTTQNVENKIFMLKKILNVLKKEPDFDFKCTILKC